MLSFVERELDRFEWANIISNNPNLSLIQTWEYGEAKARIGPWKVSRGIFIDRNNTVGAAQAMIRYVPLLKRGFVWINRAPLLVNYIDYHSSYYLEMLKVLKEYWVDERKMYLRLAPPILFSSVSNDLFENVGFKSALSVAITETTFASGGYPTRFS